MVYTITERRNGVHEIDVVGRMLEPPLMTAAMTPVDLTLAKQREALRVVQQVVGRPDCDHALWHGSVTAVGDGGALAAATCLLSGARCPLRRRMEIAKKAGQLAREAGTSESAHSDGSVSSVAPAA